MLTIKNSKAFKKIQSIGTDCTGETLYSLIFNEESEYYIPNLPEISIANVEIFSDKIIFWDYCSKGYMVFRDNTFKIEEE